VYRPDAGTLDESVEALYELIAGAPIDPAPANGFEKAYGARALGLDVDE